MKLPPRIVVALGLVSLFTDMASEMVYPLLPRLVAVLGAGAWWLGAIEGVGDATAAILKLYSGKLADRVHRRKPLALAGYALSNVVRPMVVLAAAPWQIVVVRFVDRIGKGIRSSPRDALLAASGPLERSAATFGFHRAMDNLGATLGPLLVVGGLWLWDGDIQKILLASAVPGLLAVLTLSLFVQEDAPVPSVRPVSSMVAGPPPEALRSYLLILGAFSVTNTSDLFLLRRLEELGAPTSRVALFWALLSGVRALSGFPGGLLADRIGRTRSLMLGWLLYAVAYGIMASAPSLTIFLPGFFAYGLFYGFTEGAERAIVATLAPRPVLGAAFGRFHMITGIAMLPSNLIFGLAWDRWGGPVCLAVSATGSLLALGTLALWSRRHGSG
ncbi:MAG: MFS transporter [Myxococcales bacterium]|nr:MFS transporter [Polyangiaceae bacterium]MDW8250687.1 MFS transporter [Myxococcales bacterium]